MEIVGQFLEDLFSHPSVKNELSLPYQTYSVSHHIAQPLYSCPNFSQMDFVCLILNVFSGVPESYQILRCHEGTTEEELDLFLMRVELHCAHYLVLNVNELPFKLQEVWLPNYAAIAYFLGMVGQHVGPGLSYRLHNYGGLHCCFKQTCMHLRLILQFLPH